MTAAEAERRLFRGSSAVRYRPDGVPAFLARITECAGSAGGDIETLVLDGPAARRAHSTSRAGATPRIGHLFYLRRKDVKVAAFYCEMIVWRKPRSR